jgi:hypothetical protein
MLISKLKDDIWNHSTIDTGYQVYEGGNNIADGFHPNQGNATQPVYIEQSIKRGRRRTKYGGSRTATLTPKACYCSIPAGEVAE